MMKDAGSAGQQQPLDFFFGAFYAAAFSYMGEG
jgi:hypothetical protein